MSNEFPFYYDFKQTPPKKKKNPALKNKVHERDFQLLTVHPCVWHYLSTFMKYNTLYQTIRKQQMKKIPASWWKESDQAMWSMHWQSYEQDREDLREKFRLHLSSVLKSKQSWLSRDPRILGLSSTQGSLPSRSPASPSLSLIVSLCQINK